MWRNSNSTMFELRTLSTDSKFDECFKRFVVEREFMGRSLFYDWFPMHRLPESAECVDKHFFLIFNLSYGTNYSYWMCNIIFAPWCVTLYTVHWTLILLTLGNNNVTIILIDLNQCITFSLIKYIPLFAFTFAFDECEFWPTSSHL